MLCLMGCNLTDVLALPSHDPSIPTDHNLYADQQSDSAVIRVGNPHPVSRGGLSN